MRIGIDLRCLEDDMISGVGEYALEIVSNLVKNNTEDQFILFSNAYKSKKNYFEYLEKYPNAELKRFQYPNRLLNFSLWYFGWPKLDKLIGGVDIFFAPNINFLAVSNKCKLITTFHDLSFERFPEFFTKKTRLWHYFFVNPRHIAQISSRIIAVSASTAKDLEEIYKITPEKICVVHHGISDDFKIIDRNNPKLLEVQKKYGLPHKFILFLGNIESRKNIKASIEASKKIKKEDSKLEKFELVMAGKTSPLCQKIIQKETGDVRIIGYIDREDKPFVYNLASLFLYPSFFEGYGLPVLEAMACGTPVIASNNSSIPEVAGNSAALIDPNRPGEIIEAATEILVENEISEKFRRKGLRQAKKFSWKKCAEETIMIFNSLHNSNS
jgi:glycosyltransferase involved in cell wall biosynthesis